MKKVAEHARGLESVVVARDYEFMCSDPGQELIKNDIKELGKSNQEPTKVTADSSYFRVENIEQEGEGRELLIASGREGEEKPQGERERVYSLERFDYIKESDSWRCPGGRLLARERKQVVRGRSLLRRYVCQDCQGCPLRARCLWPGEERRTLLLKRKQLIRGEMRARLKNTEKQAIYWQRLSGNDTYL